MHVQFCVTPNKYDKHDTPAKISTVNRFLALLEINGVTCSSRVYCHIIILCQDNCQAAFLVTP
jgi:hypothetical protein